MKNIYLKISLLLVVLLLHSNSYAFSYMLSENQPLHFEYENIIGVETYDWPGTLLTYQVQFKGNIKDTELVLTNKKNGKEEVFQLSNATYRNGFLVSADVHFMAELPHKGDFRYELSVVKNRISNPVQVMPVAVLGNYTEITGSKVQIRVPNSALVQSAKAPAPVMAINQSTSWIGNNTIISPERKILSVQSETLNKGPLFVEQLVRYRFENDGEYTVKIKLIKDYPFVILDETMHNLKTGDNIQMEMAWSGFQPAKRFGTQWDRNLESEDVWLGIDKPVYTSFSKEDPRWTGMGWIENPAEKMIFRISPFGGNSVREQTPVMSFWEEEGNNRELGVFVYDNVKWNDMQYGIWQPTPTLSVYFRYTDNVLYFTYPLVSGSRSTALSFFNEKEGVKKVSDFNTKLSALATKGGKHDPKDLYYRYSQLLLMQYASLGLDRVKEWQLTYPETAKRPENPFTTRTGGTPDEFVKQMSASAMAYYPMGLNFYPGIHSIEHRILYTNYVEDYLRFRKSLTTVQRQSVEALFMLGAYVNMLEEMNAIRNSLAGTANMAADGWCVPPQAAFLFPEHSKAKDWTDYFEKQLEINGLFYTRPDVKTYESMGGRWVESMGIYNWAFLRPTSHSNIAGELYDGKNRFASPYMAARGRWMRDMLTAPINDKGRGFPPHGAHSGGYLVPRYLQMFQTAQWLMNYDPLLAEHLYWSGTEGEDVERKATSTDWHEPYNKMYPLASSGTNPHLKSTKYTGHGIVLRAGVDTPEELSIHLEQVDKGPNYRWGNQAEGNTGGLYFYANGKVYTAHENEIAGDHIVNNLDGLTNFGVMKGGDYRTVGMNELKAPLYDFGFAQFAELLSDNGKDKYVWPDYVSRSVMLAGTDYFILFDEVGTNWRAAGRFAWFNRNGEEFPKITFLSAPARKDSWMTAQTPNAHGFYRDNFGSVLTLVTHKKGEVHAEGGKPVTIPLLNNADIADFAKDKNNMLPTGVAKIKTGKSSDIIFRHGGLINYNTTSETFQGKAGLIRRFDNGRLEMSLFKGESIGADGLTVSLLTDKDGAVAMSRDANGELNGMIKTSSTAKLILKGVQAGGKLYVNGVQAKALITKGAVEITLPEGTYQLEYTKTKPIPIESRILTTEYEKDRVKVFVESTSPCESVRMEASYDNGKTWQTKGSASKGIFYLPKENVTKAHVRAVSVNGKKEATQAKEYPVYFTSEAPHYPEGLWLKLNANEVTLSWGEVLGVQQYRLYRRIQGEKEFEIVYEGKERAFTDNKASGVQKACAYPEMLNNTEKDNGELVIYEYAVTAVNGNGESVKSPVEDTNPSSWRNWYPDTELKFKRQSAFWMPPYVYPEMVPENYPE